MKHPVKHSMSRYVQAHEKSVVLDAGKVLFPCDPVHAEAIKELLIKAEDAAFKRGVETLQSHLRRTLGVRS